MNGFIVYRYDDVMDAAADVMRMIVLMVFSLAQGNRMSAGSTKSHRA